MTFLNPTYLWALMGILVPIVIHLWNRKKVQTIKVGSIKMLTESEPKRTSNIRPNEWWLLFLRILIISLLVFILAEPIFKSEQEKEPLTYIIEPGLLNLKSMEQLLDSVPSDAQRVMAKGFPLATEYNVPATKSPVPKYWQMAQEMESLATDSIIVLTRGLASGIRGMRPTTHQSINWIVMDTGEDTTALVEATVDKDSIELLFIASDSKSVTYNTSNISKNSKDIDLNITKDSIRVNGDWLPMKVDKPLKILIVGDDSLPYEQKYIKSAYRALGKFLDKPIQITSVNKIGDLELEAYATLVWFSKNKLENPPINTLIYRPDSLANQLFVQGDSKNIFFLTEALNSENIVAQHLPEKLLKLLSLHQDVAEKVSDYDWRIMDANHLQTLTYDEKGNKKYSNLYDISKWIWLLFVIFMVIERILAKLRRQ